MFVCFDTSFESVYEIYSELKSRKFVLLIIINTVELKRKKQLVDC